MAKQTIAPAVHARPGAVGGRDDGGRIQVELQFCAEALQYGVTGLSESLMAEYLRYCADQRMLQLGFAPRYHTRNPFPFMALQDVQPVTNFFEQRVTEYQKGFDTRSDAMSFSESC